MEKKVDTVTRKDAIPCELTEQFVKIFDKCYGMTDCDRISFYEFLEQYGKASPEQQSEMLSRVCANLNVACAHMNKACAHMNSVMAEMNKVCAHMNKACAHMNVYGPDGYCDVTKDLLAKHKISLCVLLDAIEKGEHKYDVDLIPKAEMKALQMLIVKKGLLKNP